MILEHSFNIVGKSDVKTLCEIFKDGGNTVVRITASSGYKHMYSSPHHMIELDLRTELVNFDNYHYGFRVTQKDDFDETLRGLKYAYKYINKNGDKTLPSNSSNILNDKNFSAIDVAFMFMCGIGGFLFALFLLNMN